ncbi:biopolymer transport protein ExbD/TolR [Maribacter spongiicola]|uniref:Biopolymer transport protein ExbD/TolR n=1 Tax=Maribacter spongiicola TaxID=1206753 RepID=A0A4R7K7C8_9FLAO|nr:biopolymer transporter ExbD [Maribacter spongiicola]TDT46799.1 biopolymer transport protein ExbD/TolR [Maribacter spongiicola]
MKNHRLPQEVNAGSMADIAFLLLIFFLVTTSIENDAGINRSMPPEVNDAIVDIKERNLFEVSINDADLIMAEGDIINPKNLREKVIAFIDNGGLPMQEEGYCNYCKGDRMADSSENPDKAIISIKAQRNSGYPVYVAVQNEVIAAYNDLRNRESLRLFNTHYETIYSDYYNEEISEDQKGQLKERLEIIRALYPQKILEPETVNN